MRTWWVALGLLGIAACGGGGDGDSDGVPPQDATGGWDLVAEIQAGDEGGAPDGATPQDATIDWIHRTEVQTGDVAGMADTFPDTFPDALPDADPGAGTDTGADTGANIFEDIFEDLLALDTPPPTIPAVTLDPVPGLVEVGTPVTITGLVTDDGYPADALTLSWESGLTGPLGAGEGPDDAGAVSLTTDALSPGVHTITLTATNPAQKQGFASVDVGICEWAAPETFDADIQGAGWKIYDNAYWDPGGWLEMTGNSQSKKGSIYNITDILTPGDVSISFKIMTGPNVGNGADGFALSVWEVDDVAALDAVVAAAHSGGGLAYGVAGGYGGWTGNAFHVEIDTWHNVYNGTTEFHTDPTPENHIAVLLDGDAGDHELWAPVPNIEDMQWHDVVVDVEGVHVIILLDGQVIIDDEIPELDFRGGLIGFSGSTGYYTNYHRFDELQILQECVVP